jgi:hypothetical protein
VPLRVLDPSFLVNLQQIENAYTAKKSLEGCAFPTYEEMNGMCAGWLHGSTQENVWVKDVTSFYIPFGYSDNLDTATSLSPLLLDKMHNDHRGLPLGYQACREVCDRIGTECTAYQINDVGSGGGCYILL